MPAEPADQKAEEWAEREKKRREVWLAGPSEAEKREWSRRQRELRELYGASGTPDAEFEREPEFERELERRLRRDLHLARAGILGLFLNLPYSVGAKLIRSGLDAQYDYYTEPAFRRWQPPNFSSGD